MMRLSPLALTFRHSDEKPQGLIYRIGIGEGFGDIRGQPDTDFPWRCSSWAAGYDG